jgi:hypothetical protein
MVSMAGAWPVAILVVGMSRSNGTAAAVSAVEATVIADVVEMESESAAAQ